MENFFWNGLVVFGLYFLATIAVYIVLTIASRRWAKEWTEEFQNADLSQVKAQITFIVPACNEEKVIVQSVLALLNFPEKLAKVIVVNDGSRDETLSRLQQYFQLQDTSEKPRTRLSPVIPNRVFRSLISSRLLVIDKPNSGKSDSINVALQFVDTEYFAVSDADTVWEKHSLEAFLYEVERESASGDRVVAMGGFVQLMNPNQNFLTRVQAVEYMRAFLVGRCAWNRLNIVHLVSGAAGVFHTDTTLKIGGIPIDSQTEDLDLTFRLHQHCQKHGIPYKIRMIPRFVCRTWAPEKFDVLVRQRLRWQRGLVHTLWNHKFSFLSKPGWVFHLLSVGYLFWVETLAPFVALASILFWSVLFVNDLVALDFLVKMFLISTLVGWSGSFFALFVVPVDHVLSRTFKFHKFVWYSFWEMIVIYPVFIFVRIWAGLTASGANHSNWKGSVSIQK